MIQVAGDVGKFTLLNLTSDPAVEFTTLAVCHYRRPVPESECFWRRPTQMHKECFAVRDAEDARKAMIASSGALVTHSSLMLFVGAALFAYYEPMRTAGTEPSIFTEDTNSVFPYGL